MGEGDSQSEALPDFSEEESLEESMEDFEDAMESAAAEAQGDSGGGFPGQGEGSDGASGAEGGQQGAAGDQAAGSEQGGAGQPAGSPSGGSSGGMTTAEQVAILDGELNRGTAVFDDLILEEREVIRRTAGNGPGGGEETGEAGGSGGYGAGGTGGSGSFKIPPMAPKAPDYDQEIPEQVAVYAPPADIPDGDDDDVVARQLREAAMREPDPMLREKLWDEYRKYKGID